MRLRLTLTRLFTRPTMSVRNSFTMPPSVPWAEVYVRAHNLVNLDRFSLSDPQVYMYLGNAKGRWVEVGRTEEIRDDLNPTWKTTFLVPIVSKLEAKFVVWDIDRQTDAMEEQDLIGEVNFDLRPLYVPGEHKSVSGELACAEKPSRNNGRLTVTLVPIPNPTSSPQKNPSLPAGGGGAPGFERSRSLTGVKSESELVSEGVYALTSFDWMKIIRKFHLSVLGPITSTKSAKAFSGYTFVRWLTKHVIATDRLKTRAKAMAQFLLDINIIDDTHVRVFSSSKDAFFVINPYFLASSFKTSILAPRFKLNPEVYRTLAFNVDKLIFVDELDAQSLLPSHLRDSSTIKFGQLEPDASYPPVIAGTLKALVTRMTHPKVPDSELVDIVLSTYPSFTSSTALVKALVSRYRHSQSREKGKHTPSRPERKPTSSVVSGSPPVSRPPRPDRKTDGSGGGTEPSLSSSASSSSSSSSTTTSSSSSTSDAGDDGVAESGRGRGRGRNRPPPIQIPGAESGGSHTSASGSGGKKKSGKSATRSHTGAVEVAHAARKKHKEHLALIRIRVLKIFQLWISMESGWFGSVPVGQSFEGSASSPSSSSSPSVSGDRAFGDDDGEEVGKNDVDEMPPTPSLPQGKMAFEICAESQASLELRAFLEQVIVDAAETVGDGQGTARGTGLAKVAESLLRSLDAPSQTLSKAAMRNQRRSGSLNAGSPNAATAGSPRGRGTSVGSGDGGGGDGGSSGDAASSPSSSSSSMVGRLRRVGSSFGLTAGGESGANAPILPKGMSSPSGALPSDVTLMSFDPLEIVRQLTLFEYDMYAGLERSELLSLRFSKRGREYNAPHVVRLITFFNNVSSWVRDSILSVNNLAKRVELMGFFVTIASLGLSEYSNFSLAMAVLSGFNASPVHRLKASWDMLQKRRKIYSLFQQTKTLLSHSSNYKLYRAHLAATPPPCVPYLGMFLSDLTFGYDGNPTSLPGDLIHVQKFRIVNRILKTVARYQSADGYPGIIPVPGLQIFLRSSMASPLAEETAYTLSLKLEPRKKRPPPSLTVLQDENDELRERVQILEDQLAMNRADVQHLQSQFDSLNSFVLRLVAAESRNSLSVNRLAPLPPPSPHGGLTPSQSAASGFPLATPSGGGGDDFLSGLEDEEDPAAGFGGGGMDSDDEDDDDESGGESDVEAFTTLQIVSGEAAVDPLDEVLGDGGGGEGGVEEGGTSGSQVVVGEFAKQRRKVSPWLDRKEELDEEEELADSVSTNVPLSAEIPIPSATSFSNPVKVGYLKKKGGGLKWQKRFVVLSDQHVFYFKKETDAAPAGIIWLRGYDVRGSGKKKWSITLSHPKLRVYEFVAGGEGDHADWIAALMTQV